MKERVVIVVEDGQSWLMASEMDRARLSGLLFMASVQAATQGPDRVLAGDLPPEEAPAAEEAPGTPKVRCNIRPLTCVRQNDHTGECEDAEQYRERAVVERLRRDVMGGSSP